jgi:hypothetical protein
LGWPDGIGLGLGSVLLRKVSGSILSGANLGGLFSFFEKNFFFSPIEFHSFNITWKEIKNHEVKDSSCLLHLLSVA